eukprot:gene3779-4302_t
MAGVEGKIERGERETGSGNEVRAIDKCLTIKGKIGCISIYLNPVVTIFSAVIIWGFVIWCIVKPEGSLKELSKWKNWIGDTWTWFYIGTQDVWALFIIVLYFSKYSNFKLGKDDEKPEYSDVSYFTMLFAAGIGIGLFYFGVAEPIYHYEAKNYGNRYWNRYTDNQRAQDAINLTFFHWGIHGWIVYVVIGLILGFLCYRKDLPMTMRTCFYPILGEKVFGIFGDLIDILSVVCTMFGVCTSLGLGVIQLNAGFKRMNSNIEMSTNNQIITIWGITALATASVISGIKLGIRRLSEICFAVGMFILTIVFFYDKTWYLLNLYVQSIGYYLQYVIQLGFHTDAFAQLGNAPDGKESPNWMDGWTIFYWGWWIAWSPFVGMFIAKISRGRTIKDFITYTLTIPILYTFLWLTVFGGAGLLMERNAAKAGIMCNSTLGGATSTASLNGLYRLSCRGKNDMWFDVMEQYGDLGRFLSILSLLGIVLYFVTSSDSGSLVIDCLSANGNPDPPVLQRIFWALTEGACATALLKAGGTNALTALQTASITAGLPYTVVLNFICVGLWRAVKEEAGDYDPKKAMFTNGIFDINTMQKVKQLVISVFAPWWYGGKVAGKLYRGKPVFYMVFLAVVFYLWLILMIVEVDVRGISYVAWTILFVYFAYVTGMRINARSKYDIDGNMVEDFFAVMLLYPLATVQLLHQVKHGVLPAYNNERVNEVGIDNVATNGTELSVPPSYEKSTADQKIEVHAENTAF